MNSCRVWAKELGFSKFKRNIAWVKGTHEQEQMSLYRKITHNDRAKNLIYIYKLVQ